MASEQRSGRSAVGLEHPAGITRALAFRATVAAAAGLAVVAGSGSAAWAGLQKQARLASERIGLPNLPPPLRDGFYLPDGAFRLTLGSPALNSPASMQTRAITAPAVTLDMLGDSTMAGYGAAGQDDLPGVMLARSVAAELGRPVHLRTRAVVGSGAAGLACQVREAMADQPEVAVISVGANDVRDRVAPSVSVAELAAAVIELTSVGISVVVGTCPDLGVITPIPQPLRQLAGLWSRALADKQEHEMRRLGVSCIPLGRIVSPEFVHHPDLFSPDKFHPSGAGYARAVAALLPAVLKETHTRDRREHDERASGRQPQLSTAPEVVSPSAPAMLATS